MNQEVALLAVTAATIGFVHTLMGPDHYLPFIVLGRARGWSGGRTAAITLACGAGHVLSSVLLGAIGIALGLAVSRLEAVEAARGDMAAWLLIALGLLYFAWGLRRAVRRRHAHAHAHSHAHTHADPRGEPAGPSSTPWVLFIVFVLGPCEPLIPLLMVPAARHSLTGVGVVSAVFAVATLATMLGVVMLGRKGLDLLPMGPLERYSHALAGASIVLCGVGIRFLGL